MRQKVQDAINTRLESFKDIKSLLSLYKTELDTNKGYNGRQLLEMFQNCEDEGAHTVVINLDTENCYLEISNIGGRPFSLEGYDSLLYPGLSSKVSSGYIGNKGLGFRSIVNWAKEINIISNGFVVVFKESNKKKVLLETLNYSEEELNLIRKKRRLKPNVYPIPLLNCGIIEELKTTHSYTTTVSINYDENYEKDIKLQIEDISVMTLLFLKNINKVVIKIDGVEKVIEVSRSRAQDVGVVYHGNQINYIIEDEGVIGEEILNEYEGLDAKRYSVKIAFTKDLSLRDKVIYNFFKTQIPFELPFVAHASLELDQNRNHTTESPINDFVFKKLFNLHCRLIKILKEDDKKSWLPYRTIATETYHVFKDYENIVNNEFENLEVYPTFSSNYNNKKNVFKLNNTLTSFIENNNLIDSNLNSIVISCDNDLKALNYIFEINDIASLLEKIGSLISSYSVRAEYIALLIIHYPGLQLSVLLDNDGVLIDKNDFVYTSKTNDNINLKVPKYSSIKFIQSELFAALVIALDLIEENNKSRALAEKLYKLSNVHSFEPQVVVKKIISETNNLIENGGNSNEIIKEFYTVLFHNYSLRDENPKLEYDSIIPCLNVKGEIVDIKKLVLSEEFEYRKRFLSNFDELYGNEDIITSISDLGLTGEKEQIQSFLVWLGINKNFIIYLTSNNVSSAYKMYLESKCEFRTPSFEVYNIKLFDKFLSNDKLTISKLLHFLNLDETVKEIFDGFQNTKSHEESLSYFYHNTKLVYSFHNYIFFQINEKFNISNYLITTKRDEEWFNPFKVDYEYLLEYSGLERREIEWILKFFGAKDNFNDLSIDHLRTKTIELSEKNNHKGAQVFYKNLVGHYKQHQQQINDVKLYAKKGSKIVIEESRRIFYSDRIQLPENLTNDFPILYYPARSGGMTAIELFGLLDLNDLDLKIEDIKENVEVLSLFESFIKEIKPFILAYRLDKISSSKVKENQAILLNKLNIKICSYLSCSLNNNPFYIDDFNYIVADEVFYFKIPNGIKIEELKSNKIFADNLSDLFLKLFDTQEEKMIFESVIRQSKEDNLYDLNNIADGLYEEALILLGEFSSRLSIWKSISKVLDIDFSETNENSLNEWINLKFPILEGYELFNSAQGIEELSKIRTVFEILGVSLKAYNRISDMPISFNNLFLKELNSYWTTKKKEVKNQLWNQLKIKNRDHQSIFLKYLKDIENLDITLDYEVTENMLDYNKYIVDKLHVFLPEFKFDLTFESNLDYDSIQLDTDTNFSFNELQLLKSNLKMESLKYFEGNIDFLREWIENNRILLASINDDTKQEFRLLNSIEPECINEFSIITNGSILYQETRTDSGPWLGKTTEELSNSGKKELGNDVEKTVVEYLKRAPNTKDVDHVSKTDEGVHYDIKYFDTDQNIIKYVECKYYNGYNFLLSREEKQFADANIEQYEIWLVDKYLKIYPIRDIKKLGDLSPSNYKVNIKINTYDHKI